MYPVLRCPKRFVHSAASLFSGIIPSKDEFGRTSVAILGLVVNTSTSSGGVLRLSLTQTPRSRFAEKSQLLKLSRNCAKALPAVDSGMVINPSWSAKCTLKTNSSLALYFPHAPPLPFSRRYEAGPYVLRMVPSDRRATRSARSPYDL